MCSQYKAHLLKGQLELLGCGLLSEALDLESTISSSADEAGSGSPDSVIQWIAQYVENSTTPMRGTNPPRTRILVELKRQLVADFLKACSTGSITRKCPYCSAPARVVKQEQGIRIFLKGLSRKASSSWVAARNARTRARLKENSSGGPAVQAELGLTDIQAQAVGGRREGLVTAEECMKQSYISPLEAREHVQMLWVNERTLMAAIFGCGLDGAEGVGGLEDMFFLDVVPVPPSRFRPVSWFCHRLQHLHVHVIVCSGIHYPACTCMKQCLLVCLSVCLSVYQP